MTDGTITIKPIAKIKSGFTDKFGIPRQSGLVENIHSQIIFEEEFRNKDSLRGLEEFSHLWIIWLFSENIREKWSPTVRPPRLGGNERVGVFATRSPFRPNPIGLSCVKIESIGIDKDYGPIITVSGADILDGTPIFDIKPYIPHTDLKNDALSGFSGKVYGHMLNVVYSDNVENVFPDREIVDIITALISQDPRPGYQKDQREYGLTYDGYNVKFHVEDSTAIVTEVEKI